MDKTHNILILEKEPAEAEVVELQLKKSGIKHTSLRIGNRDTFLSSARDFAPDLVIANMAIPRFDILAALEQARELIPGVPWIVVGQTATEEQAVAIMRAGASDFVAKKNFARLGPSAKAILERKKAEVPKPEPAAKPERQPTSVETEKIYRQIVESGPDLIAVVNLDGRREYNSPSYTKILDEPEFLQGTDSFVDIHPDDRERIKQIFKEIVATGVGRLTEYRLMDKEGNTRFIESSSSVVPGPDGKPERVVVMSRDVTLRVVARQMFETLVASTAGVAGEQFFQVLVRQLAEALEVKSVLVSRVVSEDRSRVRSIAYWANGALQPEVEYDVTGTACEQVVKEGKTVTFADSMRSSFALSPELGALDAESYCGTPLPGGEGVPAGHLMVIDNRELTEIPRKEFILRVFAHRAALELFRSASVIDMKSRDAAARNAEARLKSGLEGFPDPIVMTDENDVITFVNGGLERLTGFRAAQLVGKRSWPLVFPGGSWQLLKEEYPENISRADGSTIPVNVFAIPCRNSDGRIAGTLSVLRSGSREAGQGGTGGEAIAEQNAWLQQLGTAVIVRMLDDRIAFWNAEAERLYGWTSDEVVGKPFSDIIKGKEPGEVAEAVETTLERGEWSGECRHYNKAGREVQVDSRWSVVLGTEGIPQALVIANTDLLKRRAWEMTVARRERLEGVVSLADSIGHDFQELSAPVMLASESLLERPPNEQVQKIAEMISTRMRTLNDLVKQINHLTVRQEGELPGATSPQGKSELIMIFEPESSVRTLLQLTLEANGYRTIPADDTEQGVALFSQHGERIRTVLLRPDMTDVEDKPLESVLRDVNPNVTLIATAAPQSGGAAGGPAGYSSVLARPFSPSQLLETLDRVLHKA